MPFTVETKAEQGFTKLILKDTSNNTFVEIIPSCGAILHAFTVLHKNEWHNVIEQYESENDFKEHVGSKGFKSCKLSPFACRINNAQYKFGEATYTVEKFLLGKNALHGLLYDAAFTVTAQYTDEDKASVTMHYQYDGREKGYPFQYDCIITYQLKKENALSIKTTIINRSEGLMPIQDGWHPYFILGGKIDDLQLEFQSKEKVEMIDMIPTGTLLPYDDFNALKKIGGTFFDDCFSLNFAECQPLCVLRNAEQKIQLEIHPAKTYPYLQIYTPDHRNSIALENLSAPPDAFNNAIGLIVLAPQEATDFETTYKIRLLD
jgi:aldose 1-epimerase